MPQPLPSISSLSQIVKRDAEHRHILRQCVKATYDLAEHLALVVGGRQGLRHGSDRSAIETAGVVRIGFIVDDLGYGEERGGGMDMETRVCFVRSCGL